MSIGVFVNRFFRDSRRSLLSDVGGHSRALRCHLVSGVSLHKHFKTIKPQDCYIYLNRIIRPHRVRCGLLVCVSICESVCLVVTIVSLAENG